MSNHGNPNRAAWIAHLRKMKSIKAAYESNPDLWVAWMRGEGHDTQAIAKAEHALFKDGSRAAVVSC